MDPEPVSDEEDGCEEEEEAADDFDDDVPDQSELHAVVADVDVAPVIEVQIIDLKTHFLCWIHFLLLKII